MQFGSNAPEIARGLHRLAWSAGRPIGSASGRRVDRCGQHVDRRGSGQHVDRHGQHVDWHGRRLGRRGGPVDRPLGGHGGGWGRPSDIE